MTPSARSRTESGDNWSLCLCPPEVSQLWEQVAGETSKDSGAWPHFDFSGAVLISPPPFFWWKKKALDARGHQWKQKRKRGERVSVVHGDQARQKQHRENSNQSVKKQVNKSVGTRTFASSEEANP